MEYFHRNLLPFCIYLESKMSNINWSSLKVKEKHLLKERNLIFFVDLDETLVHISEYTSHKAAVLWLNQRMMQDTYG